MSAASRTVVAVVILGGIAAGGYYYWQSGQELPVPAPPPTESGAPPTAGSAGEPAKHYPIGGPEEPLPPVAEAPLPTLAGSDSVMSDSLTQLLGSESSMALVQPDRIITRIVATVDNLPRRHAAARMLPLKPVGSSFAVEETGSEKFIAPGNPARYSAYVSAVQAIDAARVVALYRHFYPLFQQAYQELGYPKGYFNDRLVEAVDDLLDAPAIDGSVALVQPKVMYQFADPELEARSAGQKIMIRMGPANAAKVKAKLREIRKELTRREG